MENRILLESGIRIKARLKVDMEILKSRMAEIGALRLISDGTTLSYEISNMKTSAVISLGHEQIRINYWPSAPSKATRRAALARLLSIAVSVEDLYSIELSSIYTEIIDNMDFELNEDANEAQFVKYSKRLKRLGAMNYLLYKLLSDAKSDNLKSKEAAGTSKRLLFESIRSAENSIGKKMQNWKDSPSGNFSNELREEYVRWCGNGD
jgi:hypothetical protein